MAVKKDALTTTARFKTAYGVSGSGDDSLIEICIDAATDWLQTICDRKLKGRHYNGKNATGGEVDFVLGGSDSVESEQYIYFDGSPSLAGRFDLPQYPIIRPADVATALTFVLYRLTSRSSSGGEVWETLVENDDYIVEEERGTIRMLSGTFGTGTKNYRVKCTAGYKVGSAQPYAPVDLESLCQYIANKLYTSSMEVTSESGGSRSSVMKSLEEDFYVRSILGKYRRLSM